MDSLFFRTPFTPLGVGLVNTPLIDASAEKVAFIGRVWWNGTDTSKSIRNVVARLGAVTAGTATFRVSLQDVDLTTGPVAIPDGVVDQSWTTATTGLTANATLTTGNLSADRTVTKGDLIAVVFDYSAFGSSASVVIQAAPGDLGKHQPIIAHFTAAWAALASADPNVAFVFSDGTRGTLAGCGFQTQSTGVDFNSGTASSSSLDSGDERGTKWVPTRAGSITGLSAAVRAAAGADFELCVYRDTTLLDSIAFDANALLATGAYYYIQAPFDAPITFSANDNLYLVVKPTTANSVRLPAIDFAAAADIGHCLAGQALSWAQRADAGAWVTNTGADTRIGSIFPHGTYSASSGGSATGTQLPDIRVV